MLVKGVRNDRFNSVSHKISRIMSEGFEATNYTLKWPVDVTYPKYIDPTVAEAPGKILSNTI